MEFLIYTQYYPPEIGAPQTRLKKVADELLKAGHEVRVVTSMPNYPTGKVFSGYRTKIFCKEMLDGIEVLRCPIFPVKSSGILRMLSYVSFMLSSLLPYIYVCIRYRPTYVLLESPPLFLGLNCLLSKIILKQKWIFNIADLWPESAHHLGFVRQSSGKYQLLKGLACLLYRNCDYVSLVQPGHALPIRENYGVRDDKILYLPNCCEELTDEYLVECAESLDVSLRKLLKGARVITYAGNHGKAHKLEVVIDLAESLKDRSDIHFLLVGDGSEKERLLAYAQNQRLTNITFLPPVSLQQIYGIYHTSFLALCVMNHPDPAVRSAKVFTALSCRVPTMYIGDDDTSTIVERYQPDFVFRDRNIEQIAATIEKLSDMQNVRSAYFHASFSTFLKEFTWKVNVRKWVERLLLIDGRTTSE